MADAGQLTVSLQHDITNTWMGAVFLFLSKMKHLQMNHQF